jgi:hypothetical protein
MLGFMFRFNNVIMLLSLIRKEMQYVLFKIIKQKALQKL